MITDEWWDSLTSESSKAPDAPNGAGQRDVVRRAPRNRLTRWAALAAAAKRYRDGQVTAEVAAKQAAVAPEEFEAFLHEWHPADHGQALP